MKTQLGILVASLMLTACGAVQGINQNCQQGDAKLLCQGLFGQLPDDGNKDREQDAQLAQLRTAIDQQLRLVVILAIAQGQLRQNINQLQTQANVLQQHLAEIDTRTTVTALIDPCGDGPGYDEVLMRLSTGQIVAYFEQGGNRHLSIIPAGNYMTTDEQRCSFAVNSSGGVTW